MSLEESEQGGEAKKPAESAGAPQGMSMLVKVLLAIVGLIVLAVGGFAIVVAMQPATFRVERSATIDAPPDVVFAHVNDFHKWEDWSPWAKRDPNATAKFEGPESGEGAKFHWAGNDDVGEGSMAITESRPNDLIKIELAFVKPMEDKASVEFQFKPADEQTHVTWSMYGENNFVGKAMCMFMDMDAMIGGDFEEGLANMKKTVESSPES